MTGRLSRGPSLVDQAIEAVRAEIVAGAWPVGEKIPTEPALVEQLGIGRNSLREAIRALVHAGLLETRQGDGTYVRATSDFSGAVKRRVGRAELIEVLEVRRALEVETARLAALRRTEADADALERLRDERAEAWGEGDLARFVDRDVALHRAIAAMAGNAMLAELYLDFSAALPDAIGANVAREVAGTDELHMHDALVAAIRAGDPDAAQAETVHTLDRLIADLRSEPGG